MIKVGKESKIKSNMEASVFNSIDLGKNYIKNECYVSQIQKIKYGSPQWYLLDFSRL